MATVSGGATYDQALGGAYQYAHAYAFTPSSTQEGGYQVQVYDQADNLAAVPFTVTHDIVTPTVTMSLPVRSDVVTVTVEWFGDDGAGSGVDTYDLEVSEDGGDWIRLLTNDQSTSYPYTGQYGHSYTFRARATDNVSNTGTWAEATTVIVHVTKYYGFGGGRVAMRSEGQVTYLHADHLGSTSLLSDGNGDQVPGSRVSYYPYGQTRTGDLAALPTDFGFTGQRNDATIGLYDYHARWYDPLLGRWISADSIVPNPNNPQDLNRYAYVRNNPLVYIDPTGHYVEADQGGNYECYGLEDCMIKSVRDPIYPEGHPRAGYLIPRPEHGARHEHEPLITFEEDRLWPPIQSPKGEEVLSSVAIAVDSFAEGVCAAKAIAAWVGFIGGGSSGYKAVSSKIESSSPGLWENVLGVVGVIAVASADLVGDRLGFDRDTHEIVIGQDTVITVGLAALGFIPDPTWDLAVSTAQFLYDWYRLYNPPRTELHIGSGLHFRFHPLEIDGDR